MAQECSAEDLLHLLDVLEKANKLLERIGDAFTSPALLRTGAYVFALNKLIVPGK